MSELLGAFIVILWDKDTDVVGTSKLVPPSHSGAPEMGQGHTRKTLHGYREAEEQMRRKRQKKKKQPEVIKRENRRKKAH